MSALSHAEVRTALRTLLLTVSGLPAARAWENYGAYQPQPSVPYIADAFVPATNQLVTTLSAGTMYATGLYIVNYFGIAGDGFLEVDDGVDAILAAFPPGLGIPLPSGNELRIGGNPAPYRKGMVPLESGHAFCPVTIPWLALSYRPA